MSDHPAAARHGSIARRLTVGALSIAALSIALLTAVTLVALDIDIGSSGSEAVAANERVVVAALRSAYQASDGWSGADLSPATALSRADGYGLTVRPLHGPALRLVPAPAGATARELPVTAGDVVVGTAVVSHPAGGLSAADAALRTRMFRSVLLAAAVTFLLALGAAVLGSRRIVAPLRQLTAAVRRLGEGEAAVRVGASRAPGELGELAVAFDAMADTLQRQEELRRAVVADVAHELRTPLAVLQGELEGIDAGVLACDEAAMRSLDEEVRRLTALVDDLGVLASAEAASLSLERLPVRLDHVVEDAVSRLAPRFARHQVALRRHVVPAVVDGDARRLDQVVVNLLTNALKFSPSGGAVDVELSAGDGAARLSVTDAGPGIPPGEQSRIFDRFFRGSAAGDSVGSGIGLAVVRELVVAHAGTVDVRSVPGRGATFRVRLPLAGTGTRGARPARAGSPQGLHTT